METRKKANVAALLPRYFFKVGIATIILAFVPVVFSLFASLRLSTNGREIMRLFSLDALVLGLYFIASSRDKVEDERSVSLRLRAMAFAFGSTVLYVVVKPIGDVFSGGAITDIPGQQVAITMLLTYLLLYHGPKMVRQ